MAGNAAPLRYPADTGGESIWEVHVEKDMEANEYIVGSVKKLSSGSYIFADPYTFVVSGRDELEAYTKALRHIKGLDK